MTTDRKAEIRFRVWQAVLWALRTDLDEDEQIMVWRVLKEVWEDCSKEEFPIAEDKLKRVIEHIGQMPW